MTEAGGAIVSAGLLHAHIAQCIGAATFLCGKRRHTFWLISQKSLDGFLSMFDFENAIILLLTLLISFKRCQ
jgi:hypothetical protein